MDGVSLALKGTTVTTFIEKWAMWRGWQSKINDPENPGETIDNPQSAADYITNNVVYPQAKLDAENQIRAEQKAAEDAAVHAVVDQVEIDTGI